MTVLPVHSDDSAYLVFRGKWFSIPPNVSVFVSGGLSPPCLPSAANASTINIVIDCPVQNVTDTDLTCKVQSPVGMVLHARTHACTLQSN